MALDPRPTLDQPPVTGMPVFAADDAAVGYVKEVRGAYFKVDAPGRPDFWLPCADLARATPHQYILRYGRAELERHALDAPHGGDD